MFKRFITLSLSEPAIGSPVAGVKTEKIKQESWGMKLLNWHKLCHINNRLQIISSQIFS